MAVFLSSILRKIHRWTGLILCLLLFWMGISGIMLNRRRLIRNLDRPLAFMSEAYQHKNWNR